MIEIEEVALWMVHEGPNAYVDIRCSCCFHCISTQKPAAITAWEQAPHWHVLLSVAVNSLAVSFSQYSVRVCSILDAQSANILSFWSYEEHGEDSLSSSMVSRFSTPTSHF
ncbi:hypothetical protein SAY86_023158 [Trapa natans]|uniref:Uncharacterized protein n=1 Tax=Trapa natans TaxID=22666 RepID=A0AAN7RBA2_TRANT|nr:hypothetical protein SAY86_023158 [Trapa natans]